MRVLVPVACKHYLQSAITSAHTLSLKHNTAMMPTNTDALMPTNTDALLYTYTQTKYVFKFYFVVCNFNVSLWGWKLSLAVVGNL
jgi:hypothetical protein